MSNYFCRPPISLLERIKKDENKGVFYKQMSNHTWQLQQIIASKWLNEITGWIFVGQPVGNWGCIGMGT